MRKKALLAGATSAFEGPWVSLEEGEWVVESSPDVELDLGVGTEVELKYYNDNKLIIYFKH